MALPRGWNAHDAPEDYTKIFSLASDRLFMFVSVPDAETKPEEFRTGEQTCCRVYSFADSHDQGIQSVSGARDGGEGR